MDDKEVEEEMEEVVEEEVVEEVEEELGPPIISARILRITYTNSCGFNVMTC